MGVNGVVWDGYGFSKARSEDPGAEIKKRLLWCAGQPYAGTCRKGAAANICTGPLVYGSDSMEAWYCWTRIMYVLIAADDFDMGIIAVGSGERAFGHIIPESKEPNGRLLPSCGK